MAITPNEDPEERRVAIAELILRLRRSGIMDQRVLQAIESVPRDIFVPPESQDQSYSERALAIDCGQTISAPVIVGMILGPLAEQEFRQALQIFTKLADANPRIYNLKWVSISYNLCLVYESLLKQGPDIGIKQKGMELVQDATRRLSVLPTNLPGITEYKQKMERFRVLFK